MFSGYKTYMVALAAVLIAVGTAIQQYYASGTIDIQYVIEALIALALIFLRSGVQKTISTRGK